MKNFADRVPTVGSDEMHCFRAGFSAAWNAKEFQAVVNVAKKIPDSVLQEDADLLMYYDNATTLLGTD